MTGRPLDREAITASALAQFAPSDSLRGHIGNALQLLLVAPRVMAEYPDMEGEGARLVYDDDVHHIEKRLRAALLLLDSRASSAEVTAEGRQAIQRCPCGEMTANDCAGECGRLDLERDV